MAKIDDFVDKGIQFHDLQYVVEIFPAPLPTEIDDQEIESAEDLFRSSGMLGFNELFIPSGSVVEAESNGEDLTFSTEDFLRWQLERFNPETIYYLINKIPVNLIDIFDEELEYEKDEDYSPEDWLSEYDTDTFQNGIDFIQRLRDEATDEFYERIITAILDDDDGLTSWVETDLIDDIDEARKYDHWDVHLAIVSVGKFFPYIEAGFSQNMMMDEYRLDRVYVRNYDEGDID